MAKCVICGNESGKGRTCSSTCRSRLARATVKDGSVAFATVEPGSVAEKLLSAEEIELAKSIAKHQAEVMAARTPERWWPTEDCALWIRANHPEWIPDDYRTADQLGPGEFNMVSKPGDVNYVGLR